MSKASVSEIVFENVWRTNDANVHAQAIAIWKQSPVLRNVDLQERARQIVYVAKNANGEVVALTTAYKAYVKQFRNHFYMFRCLVTHDYSIPGLEMKLTILTRDFLESIYQSDPDHMIGMMAVVQHAGLKTIRDAIWPTTKMVYLGNTNEGHHIRVYYFKKVNIKEQS